MYTLNEVIKDYYKNNSYKGSLMIYTKDEKLLLTVDKDLLHISRLKLILSALFLNAKVDTYLKSLNGNCIVITNILTI